MKQRDDLTRLRHMLDAAHEVMSFVEGRSRPDLDVDRQLVRALLKSIEIIGEAANHVSELTRERFPQIPWVDIVGMRHRLVHVYFDIDLDLVWMTVEQDVPLLIEQIERSIREMEKD